MTTAQPGDTVLIRYILRLTDGSVAQASLSPYSEAAFPTSPPLELTLGKNTHLKALERAIVGMAPKTQRTVHLKAKDAYGPYNADLVHTADAQSLPEEVLPEIGEKTTYVIHGEEDVRVRITRATDKRVVIDGNSPLVDKDLILEVVLLQITPPQNDGFY